MIGILITLIVLAVILFYTDKPKYKKQRCKSKSRKIVYNIPNIEVMGNQYPKYTNIITYDEDPMTQLERVSTVDDKPRSLREVEQDTLSRGFVPEKNQPNHTANMWKCEYSHPQLNDLGQPDTIFGSDYPTRLRGTVEYSDIITASNMQQISRFGGI